MQPRKQLAFPLIALLALLVAACGGGSGGGQQAATATPGTPALEGAGKELLGLLAQGVQVTYKVTYQTTSPDGEQGGYVCCIQQAHADPHRYGFRQFVSRVIAD